MKKRTFKIAVFSLIFTAATLTSCGGEEHQEEPTKEETPVEEAVTTEEEVVSEEVVELPGKELFTTNGCVACHLADSKTVGPALNTIAAAYADNKDGIISFLKEEADAIVDPTQYAVMQVNLAKTKEMNAEDLGAIADYILSNK